MQCSVLAGSTDQSDRGPKNMKCHMLHLDKEHRKHKGAGPFLVLMHECGAR